MTGKPKGFPLSLSAVVEKSSDEGARSPRAAGKIATPQTATRNAVLDATRIASQSGSQGKRPIRTEAVPVRSERGAPMISDAVRNAMVSRIAKQGVKDRKVLAAMAAIPRHLFVEPALASQAYIDAALPIGHHQTISQPYIVARMIEALRANDNQGSLNCVLEIGTGCGYQAAILSLIAQQVYSIERIKSLHELAKSNLRPLRIANIRLHYGDGMLGLPQAGPFEGIILAAAGLEVPQALLRQMTIGGRLVAPVGERRQTLQVIERKSELEWIETTLEDCHFVPLRCGIV